MQEGNSYTNSDSAKMSNETTFQLRRSGVSSACVSVEVDFSPAVASPNNDQQSLPQNTHLKSIPIFNKDSNYFTPAFILQVDKRKYVENQQIYQTLFNQKIEETDEEKTEMYLPRPSKSNSFCCVCKAFFQDYLTHVNLPMHKAMMERSEFNRFIQDMCNNFTAQKCEKKDNKTDKKVPKTKTVKKEPKTKTKKISIEASSTRIHQQNFIL